MATLLAKFREFENENNGAIPTLSKAVRVTKCTDIEIEKVFNKVVPKAEYEKGERKAILSDLFKKKVSK